MVKKVLLILIILALVLPAAGNAAIATIVNDVTAVEVAAEIVTELERNNFSTGEVCVDSESYRINVNGSLGKIEGSVKDSAEVAKIIRMMNDMKEKGFGNIVLYPGETITAVAFLNGTEVYMENGWYYFCTEWVEQYVPENKLPSGFTEQTGAVTFDDGFTYPPESRITSPAIMLKDVTLSKRRILTNVLG